MDNERRLDLLRRAASAVFGSRWQAETARHVGVTSRTVQRWVVGTQPVPDHALQGIFELLVQRQDALDSLVRELRGEVVARFTASQAAGS